MYNAAIMLISKFGDLRRHKAYIEKRNLPLRKIAEETGLALGTIQRLNRGNVGTMSLATIETLCRYFKVASIADLVEYTPGESA